MREYQEYKQRFAMEIDTYFNNEERDEKEKENGNVIYNRVIKMNFGKNKNKRRLDIDNGDVIGPSRKRQRM